MHRKVTSRVQSVPLQASPGFWAASLLQSRGDTGTATDPALPRATFGLDQAPCRMCERLGSGLRQMFFFWLDQGHGSGGENHRGKGHFHTGYQGYTKLPCIFTAGARVPWLRPRLSGFSTAKALFSPIFMLFPLVEVIVLSPTLSHKELQSASLWGEDLHELFGLPLPRRFVSSLPFVPFITLSQSFISIILNSCIFVSCLGYNPVQLYFFCCSNCSSALSFSTSY